MPLSQLEQAILSEYQTGLPLSATPFADMATKLNCEEQKIISALEHLQQQGKLSRVGAVFNHQKAGESTLAAMQVAHHDVERIASIINRFSAVNHNYQREHSYNLWFVLTASSQQQLKQVIHDIESATQHKVMSLPMEHSFHIDLAFPLEFEPQGQQL